jgi:predicted unusual protein kinase regulating ubiquinone biosynthesis (AarF/ABC1/UbiB family)
LCPRTIARSSSKLAKLQASAEPHPFKVIRKVVEQEVQYPGIKEAVKSDLQNLGRAEAAGAHLAGP